MGGAKIWARSWGEARDLRFCAALVCFGLSGFAALLYETVWVRQFSLVFGTSEPAVAAVLGAYMGGLALGAAVARRWVDGVRRPLRLYGILELAIGITALCVPIAVRACAVLEAAWFGSGADLPESGGVGLTLFHLLCAFAVLALPTALMGATLPLLARAAVRRADQIGARIGLLYALNTAGAVAGTLVAAFLLLPAMGLQRTVWVGVATNALVFAVAALAARRLAPLQSRPRELANRSQGSSPAAWILPLVTVAGITSFSYEVLWTRLLSHVFGGTVYAFATMLASFLTGIVLGSALASRRARDSATAANQFARMQVGAAVASFLGFLWIDSLPGLALALGAGSQGGLAANAILAGLVLVPGATFMGAGFPFAVRALARSHADAATASARVYTWNTVGAIVGAVGTSFLWLPALGFRGTLAAAVATNLAIAAAVFARAHPRRMGVAAAAGVAGAAVLAFPPPSPQRLLRVSPLELAAGRPVVDPAAAPEYFAVGRSATVMLMATDSGWSLRSNGLPEAGMRPRGWHRLDDVTQWLGALPVMARPETRSMLLIGLGAGSTVEAVPESVTSIDVIEIEPQVIEANRAVADKRGFDPLSDPRVRIHVNDARGALQLSDRRYGAIVSQPSHPWTAGASHLFTREFFDLVSQRLEPGGVFALWMGLDFVDESLLRSLAATLNDSFDHVRFYGIRVGSSIVALASQQPLPVEATSYHALAGDPDAFAAVGVYSPEDLAAVLLLDEAGTRSLAGGAPVSRDDYNRFQVQSPRALSRSLNPVTLESLVGRDDPLLRMRSDWNAARVVRRLLLNGEVDRAQRVAERVSGSARRETCLGLVAMALGDTGAAVAHLRRAVALDPSRVEARAALARATRRDVAAGPRLAAITSLLEAWSRAEASDWGGVAALEPDLRAIPAGHPLAPDALRLRAGWRLELGKAPELRHAVALIDRLLPQSHKLEDVVARARVLNRLGERQLALATLLEVVRSSPPDSRGALLDHVAAAVSEISEDDEFAVLRNQLALELHRRVEARLESGRRRAATTTSAHRTRRRL